MTMRMEYWVAGNATQPQVDMFLGRFMFARGVVLDRTPGGTGYELTETDDYVKFQKACRAVNQPIAYGWYL